MSEVVKQLESALSDQPANPLRNHQVQEYQAEASRLQSVVNAPPYVTGVDRGGAARQYKQVAKLLDEQAAKPLSGAKKDQVAKAAAEVLETVIRPAMLPREEMRRNPAGAVGKFLRTENSPEIQQAIQHWKRSQLALEPGSNDPDLANVERFRPEIHVGGPGTFMAGAQIPGNFAMSAQAKENWPLGEPTINTAVAQVRKREQTQAQKDGLAKARAARAAKKEQAG